MTLFGWIGCAVFLAGSATGGLIDLFDSTVKDFGYLPRGSVNVHRFTLTNTTGQTIRLSDVRSSCRCATPKALQSEAAPGEKLEIEVAYDTTSFMGERSMTIYATFTEPNHETVSLRVSGISRSDVVYNPSQLDFGAVDVGAAASKSVRIEYAGAADWRITEVINNPSLEAELKEVYRETGRVGYDVAVRLKPGAPPGPFSEMIRLKTNDAQSPTLNIAAQGSIEADLAATPAALAIDEIKLGDKLVKRVMVRGKTGFNVESIAGETDGLAVKTTDGERKVHVLSIEIEPKTAGKFNRKLVVHTDRKPDGDLVLPISATVKP